jgi:hypothetical protein
LAAEKAKQKAIKAASSTSAAAETVAQTEEATSKARSKAEAISRKAKVTRVAVQADKQAKKAKDASANAVKLAERAAKIAAQSDVVAAKAREADAIAIKARANQKALEIEIIQAERSGNLPPHVRRGYEKRLAELKAEAKSTAAVADKVVAKVASLANDAKAEAAAAAVKVREVAEAVKQTEALAHQASKAAAGLSKQAKSSVAQTEAAASLARSQTEVAVDGTQESAEAAQELEEAAADALAAAAAKAEAEKAAEAAQQAAQKAAEAAERAARIEAESGKNLHAPELYLNRELTWLNFNKRVLHEAEDKRTPLLERVKFLAIVGSNLDEFFMKRIGGLKQQVGAGVHELTVDGRTPSEQIQDSLHTVREILARVRETYRGLVEELREHDIFIASYDELSEDEKAGVRAYYLTNIFPLVTPLAMDPAHPFPHISNLSLNLLITLHHPGAATPVHARVKVPSGLDVPRFLRVGAANHFVALEEVMAHNLDVLFPDMEIDSCELFRVTRNANTEREEDQADDLLELIES